MSNQVIYKYYVSLGPFSHRMPKGARILCVQMQDGVPQIWALVDPNVGNERRDFAVIGTGISDATLSKSQYIGTFQDPPFVWHLFEMIGG